MAEPATTSTRSSLLLRVRDANDHEAWKTFVDLYGRLVYNHCRKRGLGHEDAENVTQEVFAQVSQSIRKFDYQPERGRFRDWLGTLTRNEINRFLKKEARVVSSAAEGVLDNATARAEDTAWTEELVAASQGVDLFLLECTTYETQLDLHLSYPEIARRAGDFGCRRLVLTHLGSEPLAHAAELTIECAQDGQVIEL